MKLKQVSVFLQNAAGRLADVTKIISEKNINIDALSLADTKDFGVLRMIVNDPDKCTEALKKSNFVVKETDVIALDVDDKPGGLHKILEAFEKAGLNIEYMYAAVQHKSDKARMILRIDDIQKALEISKKI